MIIINIRLKYIPIIVLLFCFIKISYAEDKSGYDIKFSNTFFIEHFSDVLYDEVRTEHKTIADKPSFNFDEKFQVIMTFKNDNSVNCCINIPSDMYMSVNVIYAHNENYAICTAVEGEFGFGNYTNPYITAGMGFIYQHDMVFNVKKYDDYGALAGVNCFFLFGYRDDIHLYINFTPGELAGEGINRPFINIDTALGNRKLSHFFIRFYSNFTENRTGYPDEGEYDYSYKNSFMFLHLQYYSDFFGLSAGLTKLDQKYIKITYNNITDEVVEKTIDHSSARGGGLTFYANNSDSSAELFGEFHLLADKDLNWITISKIGFKIYF